MVGPGHGAPAVLANLWLEGTLGDTYPAYARDAAGLEAFVRAFSWPGGLPSHVTALTPGAIHEGGELGYALVHAAGAAMDNPDLMVACMVGDGEAETGPLAASWHYPKFLNPATDGRVLPVLHLNGYKLSGPTIFARMSDERMADLFRGYGFTMRLVAGDTPGGAAPAAGGGAGLGALGAGGRPAPGAGAAHAEGHDRAEIPGRRGDRGHVPQPPGADRGPADQSGASAGAGELAAVVRPGQPVRCGRRPGGGGAGRAAGGQPATGPQPARQRRQADPQAGAAAAAPGRGRRTRGGGGAVHHRTGQLAGRGVRGQPG